MNDSAGPRARIANILVVLDVWKIGGICHMDGDWSHKALGVAWIVLLAGCSPRRPADSEKDAVAELVRIAGCSTFGLDADVRDWATARLEPLFQQVGYSGEYEAWELVHLGLVGDQGESCAAVAGRKYLLAVKVRTRGMNREAVLAWFDGASGSLVGMTGLECGWGFSFADMHTKNLGYGGVLEVEIVKAAGTLEAERFLLDLGFCAGNLVLLRAVRGADGAFATSSVAHPEEHVCEMTTSDLDGKTVLFSHRRTFMAAAAHAEIESPVGLIAALLGIGNAEARAKLLRQFVDEEAPVLSADQLLAAFYHMDTDCISLPRALVEDILDRLGSGRNAGIATLVWICSRHLESDKRAAAMVDWLCRLRSSGDRALDYRKE